jgi:hypothetical protein
MRFIIRRRSEFPPCLRNIKEVVGICAGGCIDQTDTIDGAAHAHTYTDEYKGWICLDRKGILKERLTLLHEAAHLLIDPNADHHGKEWRRAVVSIGGTYKAYTYTHWYSNYNYTDFIHTRSGKTKERK